MVDQGTLNAWRKHLRGPLFGPDDTGYDEACRVFNGMVDKRPGVIVRCAGVADVMAAVRFAREADLPVAIRGGGHGVTGSADENPELFWGLRGGGGNFGVVTSFAYRL